MKKIFLYLTGAGGIFLSLFYQIDHGFYFLNPLKNPSDGLLFWNIRLPRLLLSFFAGSSLSISGLFFQGIFRNDLASPYTLGIAAGSSFGVNLGILWGTPLILSWGIFYFDSLFIFSFLGAFLAVLFILSLSRIDRLKSPHSLILLGIIVSFIFSSAIMLMQFLAQEMSVQSMIYWMMGDLSIVGYEPLYILCPLSFLIYGMLYQKREVMNILAMGDRFALSRGIAPYPIRRKIFILVSFLISLVVSVCGPIGFIGLVIPHITKKIWGQNMRTSFFPALGGGGIFLVWCDFLSRFLFADLELPVGIITASLGGPFFLYLLVDDQ